MTEARCPFLRLNNFETSNGCLTDTLHAQSSQTQVCQQNVCKGSIMAPSYLCESIGIRSKTEVLAQSKAFVREFYKEQKLENSPTHENRWREVQESIHTFGDYELTREELQFGAQTAWRNAPRCIGRKYWNRLELIDARHVTNAKEMFDAICRQIEIGTNNGNIRSAITVFPRRIPHRGDFRVWNSLLISYAGHKMEDGTIIGDPANVKFTKICEKLGYKFEKKPYEILPLVLEAAGNDPEVFTIPQELIHEVHIRHPKYDVFEKLGVRWFALPAVSNMLMDVGGLKFPAAPFNGWYMTTEIAVRDLCDTSRLNLLPRLAEGMGFDTSEAAALWKDRAIAEVHYALMQSFKDSQTTIVDHYTATELFMEHYRKEHVERGGCPADWVWLVPPISGSMCPVFHQEMTTYKLKPSYDYQEPAWVNHVWKSGVNPLESNIKLRFTLKTLSRVILHCLKLCERHMERMKCRIVFASETGTAAKFANTLSRTLKSNFNVEVVGADQYSPNQLVEDRLTLFIASTFGNGEPPKNAESFFEQLRQFEKCANSGDGRRNRMCPGYGKSIFEKPLKNLKFGVFALGSRSYPHFCQFGHSLDDILFSLGGQRIISCGEGDEMKGQEQSFKLWVVEVFKTLMKAFYPTHTLQLPSLADMISEEKWTATDFRVITSNEDNLKIEEALSQISHEKVIGARLRFRRQLQSLKSDRKTLLASISRCKELEFEPGDHIVIFPSNERQNVESVLGWVKAELSEGDTVFTLQQRIDGVWQTASRLPSCSLRFALTNLLDLRASPSQGFLRDLSQFTSVPQERSLLNLLSKNSEDYEVWKTRHSPDISFLAKQFPTAAPTAAFLLNCLPIIKPRYYSISSSPSLFPLEIHITAAVVKFNSEDGREHTGFCSSWLESSKINSTIPCYIRKAANFRLPTNNYTPVIMVGAGTGIAPFRSFWQQREFQRIRKQKLCFGPFDLYFGCRSKFIDQIYREEIEKLVSKNIITRYHVALSREKGEPKMYVQNLMWLQKESVYEHLVVNQGVLYICGDVRMADDVTNMLKLIIEDVGSMESDEVEEYIEKMKHDHRFHLDIFGATSVSKVKEQTNNFAVTPKNSSQISSQNLLITDRLGNSRQ